MADKLPPVGWEGFNRRIEENHTLTQLNKNAFKRNIFILFRANKTPENIDLADIARALGFTMPKIPLNHSQVQRLKSRVNAKMYTFFGMYRTYVLEYLYKQWLEQEGEK